MATPEETYVDCRSKLKEPDDSPFYYHPNLERILLGFWAQIMVYRNNGKNSIDNNIAEWFMKPLVNERKNAYFYGSDRMANVSVFYHTLISTCKLMKVSASQYFSKVFAKIVRGCTDYTSFISIKMGNRAKY